MEETFPAQMNRYRFDLILAKRYWNCSAMENLSCLNAAVKSINPLETHEIHLPFSCKR